MPRGRLTPCSTERNSKKSGKFYHLEERWIKTGRMLLKSLGARGVVYLGKAVLGNSSQGSHQPLCTAEPYQKNKTTPHPPPKIKPIEYLLNGSMRGRGKKLPPALKRQRQSDLQVQGQPGQSELQDIQDCYTETLSQEIKKN